MRNSANVCMFIYVGNIASRGVNRMVMTKGCACALYLITKWAGDSHF
jgi:hypothetical protein